MITAVLIGNVLEWYEIYLYVYWAPIMAELFFNSPTELLGLTHIFLIFALGFLSRPIGGLFFGRLGDRIGRKKSLVLSIMMMIGPTFVTGLLPTYQTIGAFAPWILGSMRLLQSFPAGGELPGAFCYLYESSPPRQRRFLCSWATVGYQTGILISTIEYYFMEKYLTRSDLISWGWRVSFIVGGLIGFCGLLLRYKLHETPLFKEMVKHEKVVKEPILDVLYRYRIKIVKGILFCALNSSAFYLLSVNLPSLFVTTIGTSNPIFTICFLLFITLPLPLFGYLGDKFDNRKLLVGSTIAMMILLYPLYQGINSSPSWLIIGTILLYGLFFTWLSALIPFIVADLFPTDVRFTCTAVSFNLADAVIGGFTPFAALILVNHTQNSASFIWILFFCSILSLSSYLFIKPRIH